MYTIAITQHCIYNNSSLTVCVSACKCIVIIIIVILHKHVKTYYKPVQRFVVSFIGLQFHLPYKLRTFTLFLVGNLDATFLVDHYSAKVRLFGISFHYK